MPIYEYFCTKCKVEFELVRPFSEAKEMARCPKCKSTAQKLVSSFGSKTGSYIQASSKPLRKLTTEEVERTKKATTSKKKRNKRGQ